MSAATIRNARIAKTTLGIEDHGIFTAFLHLDYGAAGQGFGGYALDGKTPERAATSKRPGTAFGCDFILEILRTLDVGSWEKLPGSHCRVEIDANGRINRIGHLLKDQWFDPEALAQMHRQTAGVS